MDAMRLLDEGLTGEDLDAVVAFFREANPFAQRTWGWDTGRSQYHLGQYPGRGSASQQPQYSPGELHRY